MEIIDRTTGNHLEIRFCDGANFVLRIGTAE